MIDPVAQTVMVLSLEGGAYQEIGVFGNDKAVISVEFAELELTGEQIFAPDS